MLKRLSTLFSIMLMFGLLAQTKADYDQCRAVLDWIYRDFTLKNLELSYERAFNKMLLGLHTVHKNTKDDDSYKKEMAKIFNTLGKIDPKLKSVIGKNKSLNRRILIFFRGKDQFLQKSSLQEVFSKWKTLQENPSHSKLFEGLDKSYMLDDWDEFSVNLLTKVSNYKFKNSHLKEKLESLGNKLTSSTQNILEERSFDPEGLKKEIHKTQKEMIDTFNKSYNDILYDYRNVCSPEVMKLVLDQNNPYCIFPKKDTGAEELSVKLLELQETINETGLLNKDNISVDLVGSPNVKINLLNYEVSNHPKATYCVREPENISVIVIHHTFVGRHSSPHSINRYHINGPADASADREPWHMIGYNYLISNSFQGATIKQPKVFQGRPPEKQGAHTGGKKVKLTKEQKLFMKDKTIKCGNEIQGFKEENIVKKADREGGVKGNFLSYGVALIGNYTPLIESEIAGVTTPLNLHADADGIPSRPMIEATGKLACDLQRKNSRVKKIVPHSYFSKWSECPGTLIKRLNDIKDYANSLGCDFTVSITKEDDK